MIGARVLHVTTAHQVDDDRILVRECLSLAEAGYSVGIIGQGTLPGNASQIRHAPLKKPRRRVDRMLFGPARALALTVRDDARLIHLHDPELIPAGLILRVMGRAVIYDAHEDLALQALSKAWIPRPLRKIVSVASEALERTAGATLTAIVAATPAIARKYPP